MDYAISSDLLANSQADYRIYEVLRGEVWRFGSGFQILAADTNYGTINFTTPATGLVTYSPANVDKTGFEATFSLIEGGTYVATGATTITPYNLNRNTLTASPFGTVRIGLSPAGTTITGGVAQPEELLPGASGGASRESGALNAPAIQVLKPATNYTWKILARGGVVNFSAAIDLIWEQ